MLFFMLSCLLLLRPFVLLLSTQFAFQCHHFGVCVHLRIVNTFSCVRCAALRMSVLFSFTHSRYCIFVDIPRCQLFSKYRLVVFSLCLSLFLFIVSLRFSFITGKSAAPPTNNNKIRCTAYNSFCLSLALTPSIICNAQHNCQIV